MRDHAEPTANPRLSPPSYPLDQPLYYIDDASRAIALTIDDGPSPLYTPQVLRLLRYYGVTATFCMAGIHVAAWPRLAAAVAAAGHTIANHTWTHADLAALPAGAVYDQMALASRVIALAAGVRPGCSAPPTGPARSWCRGGGEGFEEDEERAGGSVTTAKGLRWWW
jgi:peptidoglycan/xylan/chitin deacetylase (PgdA/CDA1 family)